MDKFPSDRGSEAPDEGPQASKRLRLDAVADPRPIHFTVDEARLFQNLEVLGDRRLRQRQLVDDIATDAGVLADQDANDLHARRVPEGLRQRGELLVGLLSLDGTEVHRMLRGRAAGFGDLGCHPHRQYTIIGTSKVSTSESRASPPLGAKDWVSTHSTALHTGLFVLSMDPGVGMVASATDAALSLHEGQQGAAALAATAIVLIGVRGVAGATKAGRAAQGACAARGWTATARGGSRMLFRAVSEAEFTQMMRTAAFEAGPNALGSKLFAGSVADAAKWGEALNGAGNVKRLQVEWPTSTVEQRMSWRRLDVIGPAWYGERPQLGGATITPYLP